MRFDYHYETADGDEEMVRAANWSEARQAARAAEEARTNDMAAGWAAAETVYCYAGDGRMVMAA